MGFKEKLYYIIVCIIIGFLLGCLFLLDKEKQNTSSIDIIWHTNNYIYTSYITNNTPYIIHDVICPWSPRYRTNYLGNKIDYILPSYNYHGRVCPICGRDLDYYDMHTTWYNKTDGQFIFCEEDFQKLTPAERLPYYKGSMICNSQFRPYLMTNWPILSNAVMQGL